MVSAPQWLAAVDRGTREAFTRAINVAGAGTVLVQTLINRIVQQIVLRELGLLAVLDVKPGSGPGVYINRRAEGAAAEWVADTGTITEGTGTYTQTNFPYRTVAVKARITRFMQAIGRSYGDLLAGEIMARAGDMNSSIESALVVGNTGANPNQINGLLTLIGATSSQVISQTTSITGDALSLDSLDKTIDAVKGAGNRSNLVICANFAGRRQINNAQQAQQQFVNETEIDGGFRVNTYNGIPIITSTGMPSVLLPAAGGASLSAFTGGATTAILVVNKEYFYLSDLTPTTVAPLARVSSQYDEFDIYRDFTTVLSNTLGAAMLIGIKPG